MLKKNKKFISYGLLLLFLILFGFYFINNRSDFGALLDVKPIFLLYMGIGNLAVIFTNGLIIKWIMEPYHKKANYYESFLISLVSSIGNFFLPVGSGTGVRALALKKKFGLSYGDFFSTLYGNYIIVFFVNSFLGLLSTVALMDRAPTNVFYTLMTIFAAMLGAAFYMSFWGMPKMVINLLNKAGKRVTTIAANILDGWNAIIKNRPLLIKLILAALLNILAAIMVSYSAVAALGYHINIWALLLYSSLGVVVLVTNITPAAIGIKESLYIYSGALLGFSTPQILSLSVLDRGAKFFVLVFTWLITSRSQTRKITENSS